jgi:hypothetical protein
LDREKIIKEADYKMQKFLQGEEIEGRIHVHLLYEETKLKFEEYLKDTEGKKNMLLIITFNKDGSNVEVAKNWEFTSIPKNMM